MSAGAAYDASASAREVVLVRHCTSSGQWPEAALTDAGIEQALALADTLAQLDVQQVVSSPFRRAVQSVEPFCALNALPIKLDVRLVECSVGPHDLPNWREELQLGFQDLDRCLKGGESGRAAQTRALAVLQEAYASGLRCALITHGRLLALLLKSIDPAFSYEDWSRLSNPDVFVLRLEAGVAHSFRRVSGRGRSS